ncbi:3123_t:CDS:2 [Paraglomus brasilianum]|uniref:3123_t:CDS:1 n=1 Tax=Paraglomus brasilianum TaxID=144538 RepID=A0A9N9HBL7_9GLOM|nr:3123_t:CDS:2 [Paraglomus brasilianum]
MRILIDERRNRNEEYHNFGRNRIGFWDSIATRINQEHNTSFNGHQCKEKFMNLVRDYNLMCDYMAGNRRARRSRTGAQYFNEFRTHFWERPEDDFDRIRNINSSNRRQRRIGGNNTPAPSTGEVEHELGQTLLGNRRSRRTSVDSRRSRRSRRRSASPSPPRDAINTNTNNPEQNIGHSDSSLQPPPPYEATDNNSSEMNQSHVVSNREVAPLSQNDSDVSMYDVGDSQTFSNMESINEEVG